MVRIIPGFIYKKIDQEHVIIPTKEASCVTEDLIVLNDAGAFLWKYIDGKNDEEVLSLLLSLKYHVSEDKAQTVVEKFLSKMSKIGCIDWER